MSQQAAITLNTVVYAPSGVKAGTAQWVNRSAGVGPGFKVLKQTYKDPTNGTQTKIDFELSIPVVATADSDCSCTGSLLRTNTVKVSVWVASSSTAAERTDLRLSLQDLIANQVMIDAIDNLNPAF